MYILGIGAEFLPATVIVDYIVICSQLFFSFIAAWKELWWTKIHLFLKEIFSTAKPKPSFPSPNRAFLSALRGFRRGSIRRYRMLSKTFPLSTAGTAWLFPAWRIFTSTHPSIPSVPSAWIWNCWNGWKPTPFRKKAAMPIQTMPRTPTISLPRI